MAMTDPKDKPTDGEDTEARNELFSHPLAFPAIAATIGFGVVSQTLGFWLGAMSGAMQASRRMADEAAPLGGTAADEKSLPPVVQPVVTKARRAAKQIVKNTEGAAAAAADTAKEAVAATAKIIELHPAKSAANVADDLKIISGIGPKLEQVLNKLGVSTYAQIAAWTDTEISRIEDHFGFPGRVARDSWIEQARKLAGGKKSG